MLAPQIKKKVDELWNRFWAAGLTNPLVAVEQITYLLFLKRLEDIDIKRQERSLPSIYKGFETCKWSYIRQEKTNPAHLIDVVFPWLRELDKHFQPEAEKDSELASLNNRMADAYFQLDPNKGKVLSDSIDKIDELFARGGDDSAAQDIMGDTFEYLLSEMATAGKNGQFRTPRHLIRFMVELLDPEPGQRVIDPAAGTGGFLFSTQQYLMQKYTPKGNLIMEWDGTPHRTDGSEATNEQYQEIHSGANFVGLDNDRTMARIGWMNLVLHDVTDPHLLQGDALSAREGKPQQLKELLTSESYDFVLANPPFTGIVDSGDLEPDSLLFPRVGGKGKKKGDSITNKSELLFLWLMIDLLRIGGRCAVIIPEGVLFGTTEAHIRLRRELLTENIIEGIISLPNGIFQPYTSVKTSIIIFRKDTQKGEGKQNFNGSVKPHTDHVWFYEIEDDGYSLDAKRTAHPGENNDLWDALNKFKTWLKHGRTGAERNEKTLLQPKFHKERWRQALLRDTGDKLTPAGEAFASLNDTSMWDGKVWGIHDLFSDLSKDPEEAERLLRNKTSKDLSDLAHRFLAPVTEPIWKKCREAVEEKSSKSFDPDKAMKEWQKVTKLAQSKFNRVTKEVHKFFEPEDSAALPIWKYIVKDVWTASLSFYEHTIRHAYDTQLVNHLPIKNLTKEVQNIARELAKIDGFDVTLRSLDIEQKKEITTAKHWVVPVRSWARNNDWKSADGKKIGSHDADGLVHEEYIEAIHKKGLYDKKGKLKEGLLDPDCIEARDWNLSSGQYKIFELSEQKYDQSVIDLIGELKLAEHDIITGLDKLLAMVEGRA